MFESILEKALNSVLGKYIEDLDSKDLNISIWGGDIKLNDIKLKKDIFNMYKVPLDLIFGQIGELHIKVPWKNLGSSPVEVTISDIQIVVRKYIKLNSN